MIGRIDKAGCLSIKRAGQWINQFCYRDRSKPCSHNCPAFNDGTGDLELECICLLIDVETDWREDNG